jgi:glyoxylase-like metal-dependent hydrolase (beta-lactamase superfamily II)
VRIHHLNCVSACPLGGALMDGFTRGVRARLTCHCLLLELNDRLVLVDTGYGLRDVADPYSRLNRLFLFMMSPDFRAEMTAVRQIEALGFNPRDVRDIVLTHLDFDHAGGLDDFPGAAVHMLDSELHSASRQRTFLDRMRYRPQQWGTRSNWRTYTADGDSWRGFECVREIGSLPPEILMLPTRGHTFGHAAIAVADGPQWLVYAGDAYFYHAEMDPERPYCTPGLRFYQWMMEKDRRARLQNQRRLREIKLEPDIKLFCAHDVKEFETLSSRRESVPAVRDTSAPLAAQRGAGVNVRRARAQAGRNRGARRMRGRAPGGDEARR